MNMDPVKLNDLSVYDELVDVILAEKPVKNLNRGEVQNMLRMFEIQCKLGVAHEGLCSTYPVVDVYKNDKRMEGWSDKDKFLALLVECHEQNLVLKSRRCCYCFGGTVNHWRMIGRTNPITDTMAIMIEGYNGYYGQGWVIASHIITLIEWFVLIYYIKHPEVLELFTNNKE